MGLIKTIKITLILLLIASPKFAFSNEALLGMFMDSEEQASKALEQVLDNTKLTDSTNLFFAAGTAHKNGDITNAAYLFYIAKFRTQFDKKIYPPEGTGGDSPMVLFGALASQIGSVINPEIMRNPEEFSQSLKLVEEWQPEVSEAYEPGWDYKEKLPVENALNSLSLSKAEFNVGMGNLAKLLSIPEYLDTFVTIQDYNMLWDESRPSKEQFEAAKQKLMDIEKSKDIEGMYWKREGPDGN